MVDTAASVIRRKFTQQHARPERLRDVDFHGLPMYLRALLLNDGTTQALLTAIHLEAVRVNPISSIGATDVGLAMWLNARRGDVVERRHVVIRGQITRRTYAIAESVFIAGRLPIPLGRTGNIGEALTAAKVETRRELLWVGADDDFAAIRAYRILHDGICIFVIAEMFRWV